MADRVDSFGDPSPPAAEAGVETIEAYETDDGVVLYDAENPLAWVEATRSYAIEEQV
jgi:hypothetical protein